VYFLEGMDEKPRNRIPLGNAVIEGIFFRDDLFVITIRCSKEHSSFYTLGHNDEHELKDWFDQLKRAIDLANEQNTLCRRSRTLSHSESVKVPESGAEASEELQQPSQAGLRECYEEVMRLVDKGTGPEWKTVRLKNNAIVRRLENTVQLTMTFRSTPLAMVYGALLAVEEYVGWNTQVQTCRSVMKVGTAMDLVSVTFKGPWHCPLLPCLLSRHFSQTSDSALILCRSVHSPVYPSQLALPLLAFYMRHKNETTHLHAYIRLPVQCFYRPGFTLKLAMSFTMLSHSIVLAPVTGEESLLEDVNAAQRPSLTPGPVCTT